MSQWEKLISRINKLDTDLRFSELKKVLESYGYKETTPHSGSSHHTFRKKGKSPITIPKKQKIKTVYVQSVKEIVEEENHG